MTTETTPRPRDGEVHLYCLVLPQHPLELTPLAAHLSADECGRVGLLKGEPARGRFIAGRGLLREILGGYLGCAAGAVPLAAGVHGKPYLVDGTNDLGFNLSHSGDRFLLAVAAQREVGADIELMAPGKPLEEMGRMVFSLNEQDYLRRQPSPLRERAFYRCWVRKEACLKACGAGFSLPGNRFELPTPGEHAAAMMVHCHETYWHLLDIDVPKAYCAAVAVGASSQGEPPPVVVRIEHRCALDGLKPGAESIPAT